MTSATTDHPDPNDSGRESSAFGIETIRRAAERLRGKINRTPLLESPQLNARVGGRVLVKAESLQITGSFKFRGALNAVLALDPDARGRGLITYSAGNHGQGIAAAARQADTSAVVVMPRHTPRNKIERCEWWGAEVVLFDPATESRGAVTDRLIAERGLTFVAPFDDYEVMSGQGTVGLEIAEQLAELEIVPDRLATSISGGGLASGSIEALRATHPGLPLTLVESQAAQKWQRSFDTGTPVVLTSVPPTISDGIAGPAAGVRCFAALRQQPPAVVHVSDDEVLTAIGVAFDTLRLVLEPAGAATIAATLAGKIDVAGRTTVLVASGGNVDPQIFTAAIA